MIRYVIGDATQPQGGGRMVIAHVCNDIGAWGAGFTAALSRRWSLPEDEYRKYRDMNMLIRGTVQIALIEPRKLAVANMIAQRGVRSAANPVPLDYDALELCLRCLGEMVGRFPGTSVHMPRIGCGLAGGRWPIVEGLIIDCLQGIAVTIYDLGD